MTDIHSRIAELMPWFVNGTLPEHERTLVEEHVRDCLPCRRAVADERALREAVRTQDVPSSAEHGLDALLATIDSRRRPQAEARIRRRLRPAVGPAWLGLAVAACAAIAFVLFQALQPIGTSAGPPDPGTEFTTLTDGAPSDGIRVDVIFVTPPSRSELERLSDDLGATNVAGPSEIGRYTFTLDDTAELEQVLDMLHRDPRVRMAGPSFIEEGSP